ncbi:MAG: class I SAM-dependent methyltransferase [Planctomycetota bacterium]|jgi:ubiquinone/menaquinone biosynthesis C-methylase UbiE
MAQTLSFGDRAIAHGYDNVLVPLLFEPWANHLIRDHGPWVGRRVLDLATGTGVVAERLASAVGPNGNVTGADINPQMLEYARRRCTTGVRLIESGADALELRADSVDVVVCQQGFQFFPDKVAAAHEMRRVLRTGGRAVVSAWCPVSDCEIFGALCDALDSIGEPETAAKMRVPFDHLTADELAGPFAVAGFERLRLRRLERDLIMPGGIAQAIDFAYATPVGPQIDALPADRQALFREIYSERLREFSHGRAMGRMVSNELVAS